MKAAAGILALVSAVLFGLSSPISKALLGEFSANALAGILYLGAAAATVVPAFAGHRRPVWRSDRRTRLLVIGAIVFGGVLGPLLLLLGLAAAEAANVSLWLNLELVATALLGHWVFRDHLGRHGWFAVALVLAGAATVSWQAGQAGWLAGGLVALACLSWGLDNHFTALIDGIHPSQSTFWKGLVGGSTNLAIAVLLGWGGFSGTAVGLGLLVGAFSYGVSIVLYIRAAQTMGATRAQLVFASAPVWGLAGSAVFLGETLTWVHAVAVALMAGAVALLYREKHDHDHSHVAMAHNHSHRHDDGHHNHEHPGLPASHRHTHAHNHEPLVHRHPHWPDLHHRHNH